jgi:hypothetical protein
MRRQAVLQNVRVPLFWWQAGGFRARSKDAEKLCAIKPASFLWREQEIGAIGKPRLEPSTECIHLVEERLPSVLVEGLDLAWRTFEPGN